MGGRDGLNQVPAGNGYEPQQPAPGPVFGDDQVFGGYKWEHWFPDTDPQDTKAPGQQG